MSSGDLCAMEQDDYIKIADGEDSEFMEFPKEDNGTIFLSTLQAQFPHAIGLKYKGSSGAWRAIRAVDNVLDPPKGGWGEQIYCIAVCEVSKREYDCHFNVERESKISHSTVNPLLKDLAVIRLPFTTTQDELREYFEKSYGELAWCEIKYDRATGKSRGFGFVRFKDEETAKDALSGDHYKLGRMVEVRQKKDKPMKIFVGRLPHGITVEDLNTYFSQFGEVKDTFIPKPFRNFAFITMASQEDGNQVLRQTHILDGIRMNVEERKTDTKKLDKGPIPNNMYPPENNENSRGYSPYYNANNYSYDKRNVQPSQNDITSDLKNMLFEFLTAQK